MNKLLISGMLVLALAASGHSLIIHSAQPIGEFKPKAPSSDTLKTLVGSETKGAAGTEVSAIPNSSNVDVRLWTMTLPVTFSRVDQTNDGWAVNPRVDIGPAFVYMLGKGKRFEDESIVFDPKVFAGVTVNGGLANSDKVGELDGRGSIGIILGIHPVAIIVGGEIRKAGPNAFFSIGTSFQSLSLTEMITWYPHVTATE